jgi:uncharacterized peroxidase-related enzyme
MPRLLPLDPAQATGPAAELLAAVQAKLGRTPNMMRTMAHAPAVLKSYLEFSAALAHGKLDARLRERIALLVGEENRCGYCVDAHTALGARLGLTGGELLDARRGRAADRKTAAALAFARRIASGRADVTDAHVAELRAAGYGDAEIAEIVACVALNIFTNLFNHVAATDSDFPPAPKLD